MPQVTDIDVTRQELRDMFRKWGIDRSETEILWETSKDGRRLPGAIARYLRNGKWQEVSCYAFPTRARNLRQIFLFLDRVRIAENNGVAYSGLSGSKELVKMDGTSAQKESLDEAYDILGASFDDPIGLIKDLYLRKSTYYHPDAGGDAEKFKRLTQAYELIMKSKEGKP